MSASARTCIKDIIISSSPLRRILRTSRWDSELHTKSSGFCKYKDYSLKQINVIENDLFINFYSQEDIGFHKCKHHGTYPAHYVLTDLHRFSER